jgi:proteic killer suppression protein
VIKSFRHAGVENFFKTGSKAGIQPAHATKLADRLYVLDNARSFADMNIHGWNLHPLRGDLRGHWSVKVSGNWRLTFAFDGEDAILVDYLDYH